jgi:hypothetical protein
MKETIYRKILDLLDRYYDHLPLGFYRDILKIMKEEIKKEEKENLDFSDDEEDKYNPNEDWSKKLEE